MWQEGIPISKMDLSCFADSRKVPKQPLPPDFFPMIDEIRAPKPEIKVNKPPRHYRGAPPRLYTDDPPPEAAKLSSELLAMEQSYESEMRFKTAPPRKAKHVDEWSPVADARARLRHGRSSSALLNVQQLAQRDEVQKLAHLLQK